MKIITYSDLHLEFGGNWRIPDNIDSDIMILAGDIITFRNFQPLHTLLENWDKPVLYVTGNHEYYNCRMGESEAAFRARLNDHLPRVRYLQNESTSIDGVHFFGGTM